MLLVGSVFWDGGVYHYPLIPVQIARVITWYDSVVNYIFIRHQTELDNNKWSMVSCIIFSDSKAFNAY